MEKTTLNLFLAANSFEGFVSKFAECYKPYDGWKVYIIKGGPGTGKSSFMKFVAKKAHENDLVCLTCPCSSDPDSLDAVILPDKKTVILDGTAPHTLDPVYPAVCEEILNFGEFWDSEKLEGKTEVLELTKENGRLHQTASRYLQAAGKLLTDNYKTALFCTDREKAEKFAKKLCKGLIPKTDNTPYEWVGFLGGIGPKGLMGFSDTPEKICKHLVVIKDKYYASSNLIMEEIRETALNNGYEIITFKNPFLPSIITDHIIIPELSLGFVTENDFLTFGDNSRRINSVRFTDANQLKQNKQRMNFNKKAIDYLLKCSYSTLAEAKAVHDKLESYYIEAMDFEKLNDFKEKFCKKLFS